MNFQYRDTGHFSTYQTQSFILFCFWSYSSGYMLCIFSYISFLGAQSLISIDPSRSETLFLLSVIVIVPILYLKVRCDLWSLLLWDSLTYNANSEPNSMAASPGYHHQSAENTHYWALQKGWRPNPMSSWRKPPLNPPGWIWLMAAEYAAPTVDLPRHSHFPEPLDFLLYRMPGKFQGLRHID